ncbi:hypothetical protein FQR65_LT10260 [Abscondita terminalis]|nr:hypothetical protein FQR65_LT10260 [Abscondita terminalis]
MGEKICSYYNFRLRKDKNNQMSNLKEQGIANDSVKVSGNNKPSSRRVSFASSNLVKKFAEDSEKNTIWDSTYEEKIDSDSIQSSQNILDVRPRPVSSTDKNKSINYNVYGGEDIECDLTLREVTESGLETQNAEVATKKSYLSEFESHTIFDEVDMDISKKAIANTTTVEECAMEFTEVIFKKNSPSFINFNETVLNNTTMEYTCEIPIHNTKSTCVEFNQTIPESIDMEFTQGIFPNTFTSKQTNATILSHADMEETSLFKNIPLIKITNKENVQYDLTENDINNSNLKESIQNTTGDQKKTLNETIATHKLNNTTSNSDDLKFIHLDNNSSNNTGLNLLLFNNVNVNIFPSLSVCTDNTQHLINYNISNLKSNFSKHQTLDNFNSDEVPVVLENAQEDKDKLLGLQSPYSASNSVNIVKWNKENTQEDKDKLLGLQSPYLTSNSVDIVEWNKEKCSENISSSQKLCNLEPPADLHISQESLVLSNFFLLNNSKSILGLPDIVEIAKEEPLFSHNQISSSQSIWENYKQNNESFDRFMENSNRNITNSFECIKSLTNQLKGLCANEIELIKKIYNPIGSQENKSYSISRNTSDSSLCSREKLNLEDTEKCDTDELSLSLDEVLSIKEQIEKKYSRIKKCLEIEAITDESCSISTLFGSVRINVRFKKYDGIVKEMHIHDHLLTPSLSEKVFKSDWTGALTLIMSTTQHKSVAGWSTCKVGRCDHGGRYDQLIKLAVVIRVAVVIIIVERSFQLLASVGDAIKVAVMIMKTSGRYNHGGRYDQL